MSKLLVICAKRYNGHELWTLLGILLRRGHQFEVVSQEKTIRDEITLQPNTIANTVYEVNPFEVDEFDAVVVVSGNMADTEAYWTDPHVQRLLEAFVAKEKVVAAICCSVPTLAPIAGGVKVSFFPLVRSKQRLKDFGAFLQNVSLTVDVEHKVITAENQMITQMWATEICNMLEGKPPEFVLVESGYVPKGRPRRMHSSIQSAIDEGNASKARALAASPEEDV